MSCTDIAASTGSDIGLKVGDASSAVSLAKWLGILEEFTLTLKSLAKDIGVAKPDFEITKVSMNSPLELAVRPIHGEISREDFFIQARNLWQLQSPEKFSYPTMEHAKKFVGRCVKEGGFAALKFAEQEIGMTPNLEKKFDDYLGISAYFGSFEGTIEAVSLHNSSKKLFQIYNRSIRVRCEAGKEYEKTLAENIKKWVVVRGLVFYSPGSNEPRRIAKIESIKVLEPIREDELLDSFSRLNQEEIQSEHRMLKELAASRQQRLETRTAKHG